MGSNTTDQIIPSYILIVVTVSKECLKQNVSHKCAHILSNI